MRLRRTAKGKQFQVTHPPTANMRIPGIRFVTPAARHARHNRATLAKRATLYANARSQNPQRWSGKTRKWHPSGSV